MENVISESIEKIRTEVLELHGSMRNLIVKYGKIKEEQYDRIVEDVQRKNINSDTLNDIYQFLTLLKENEYKELDRIFQLPLNNSKNGPELWDRYFLKNLELREVKMFRAQITVVRNVLKAYIHFKKLCAKERAIKNLKENNHAEESKEINHNNELEENIK